MANVHCIKCGAEGTSKCPHCRNVFMEDQLVALLEYGIIINDKGEVSVRPMDPERFTDYIGMLNKLSPEQMKMICCMHDVRFKPGEHSSIGCGH